MIIGLTSLTPVRFSEIQQVYVHMVSKLISLKQKAWNVPGFF
jgi:hypothetical protein